MIKRKKRERPELTSYDRKSDIALHQTIRRSPFLLVDCHQRRQGPVVFARSHAQITLHPGLDDIYGCVDDGADRAADGARNEIDQ